MKKKKKKIFRLSSNPVTLKVFELVLQKDGWILVIKFVTKPL